jgi:hypothetical protein
MPANARYCRGCGTRLAGDNRSSRCSPCLRNHRAEDQCAPAMPDAFWDTDEMRAAFRSRDMGALVRTYRHHPHHGHRPLPQTQVAKWLDLNQGQLSRIESGRNQVRELDKLVHYALRLRIPTHLLWFDVPETQLLRPRAGVVMLPGGSVVSADNGRTEQALAQSLLANLENYANTDNLAGPRALLGVIALQVEFINRLLHEANERTRPGLLYVGARYAEFAGWLHQDAGDLNAAMTWSRTALDFAAEAGDQTLSAYVEMRRSNIASDAERPDLALTLANNALDAPGPQAASLRAVTLRQKAHAHAMRGDHTSTARALDQAFSQAQRTDDEDFALTHYCTPGYLDMEAARCWIQLDQPHRAISTLEQGLASWQPQYRRDLGLGMARLASAYARADELDHAATIAEHALNIATETGSARTAQQLKDVQRQAAHRGAPHHARRLQQALVALT